MPFRHVSTRLKGLLEQVFHLIKLGGARQICSNSHIAAVLHSGHWAYGSADG